MQAIAIGGAAPGDVVAALAARGITITREAPLVWFGPPPPDASPLLIVADLDEAAAINWLDRGTDIAPARASVALIAARIAMLLRREPPLLALGPLAIDTLARTVSRDGAPVALLPREYRLLLHLARHRGRAVSRAELRTAVLGLPFDPGTNVVAVHVSRLRAKLDRGFAAPLLLTDKGRGYRLAV